MIYYKILLLFIIISYRSLDLKFFKRQHCHLTHQIQLFSFHGQKTILLKQLKGRNKLFFLKKAYNALVVFAYLLQSLFAKCMYTSFAHFLTPNKPESLNLLRPDIMLLYCVISCSSFYALCPSHILILLILFSICFKFPDTSFALWIPETELFSYIISRKAL